jgi:hypothetical protein
MIDGCRRGIAVFNGISVKIFSTNADLVNKVLRICRKN